MSKKNLVLIIEANQVFFRNICEETDFTAQNEILFTGITDTYIPLLNLFGKLEKSQVKFKVGLVMPPVLCTLLNDPQIQKQYIDWLDRCIALGKSEVKRLAGSQFLENARDTLEKYEKTKLDFTEVYNQNLLCKFKYYKEKGFVELIATTATRAYLPYFQDLHEALNAQVETGLYAQRTFFGESGEGFFLPFCAWAEGFDSVLRSYGMNYTVVDARSLLFAEKRNGTGIFSPVRCGNSLVLFGKDPHTPDDICGKNGYMHNEVYCNCAKDIGFELDSKELESFLEKDKARTSTGYKYWANTEKDIDYENCDFKRYIRKDAEEQVKKDAQDFIHKKADKLKSAEELLKGEDPSLVCVIPAELMGQTWREGILWLEEVLTQISLPECSVTLEQCKNLLEKQFELPKIKPYPCSGDESGYGEDFIDGTNSYMIRYIRKATERMIDLTERLSSETSLKERLLNLAAKEVLLAQSGEWPLMLHENKLPDYVKKCFKKHVLSFTIVFDALASNSVSTEWLTNLEKEDLIFPWMNYRIFSRKK